MLGVITSLVAVLFPVLATARVKADAVNCAGRLRQLYTYTLLFADEHKQHLPRPSAVGENPNAITDPAYHEMCCWMQDPSAAAGQISLEVGGLWRYVPVGIRRAAVTCPGDRDEPAQFLGKLFPRNFSYSYNGNLRVEDSKSRPVPVGLTSVKRPAEKILLFEEIGPNDAWGMSYLSGDDYPSARHGTSCARATGRETIGADYFYGGRGNHCFFDGHVESLAPTWIFNPDNRQAWGPLGR
jgi:prepilin-type processing-associated H-X9-DG protein